jgi:hypothetical protein
MFLSNDVHLYTLERKKKSSLKKSRENFLTDSIVNLQFKNQCVMKLAAVIEKSNDGWYVGQLEEIPAVLSQGKTIKELKENCRKAIENEFF